MSILVDLLSTSVQRRPVLLREGLGLLRRRRPRIRFGKTVLVLDAAGVREVMSRPADFLSGMGYAQKLKLGPLVLGMDPSPRQVQERTALEHAAGERWAGTFDALVERHAEQRLQQRPRDFVTDFVEPVLVPSICELFGVDPSGATSQVIDAEPGLPTFVHWLRKLGGTLAAALPAPFGLEAVAEALAEELAPFLDAQVHSSAAPVLTQLAADLGSDSVVRCVGGNLLATATLFKSATLALNQLLRKRQLNPAVQAVAGATPEAARASALAYVYEALRFDPPFAFLTRYCPRQTALGDLSVPPDATLVVALLAAMFDPAEVADPDQFSLQRPSHVYLPFGFGLHECVGKAIAERGLAVLFTVFLKWLHAEQLEVRASGGIVFDGPAVAGYPLVYAQRAHA